MMTEIFPEKIAEDIMDKINVMVLGPPGEGKSALCNSIYRVITKGEILPCTTSAARRGNTRYSIVPLISEKSNFRLFDIPGTNDFINNKATLEALLDGVEMTYPGIHMNKLAGDPKKLVASKRNEIHFVVVVYNVQNFHTQQTGWKLSEPTSWFTQPVLKFPPSWITEEIFNLIDDRTGNLPFLVLTHRSKMIMKPDIYVKKAEELYPTPHIYFVENYTQDNQSSQAETDSTILNLLQKMLVKSGRSELDLLI